MYDISYVSNEGVQEEECMREWRLPGQGSRVTRFQILENTGYLGVSSYWVCQENSINKRPSIELTVFPNCEPLSSQTFSF